MHVDNTVHDGIYGHAADGACAEFLGNVAAVEYDGCGGYVECVGYLLVYISLYGEGQHILFALREQLGIVWGGGSPFSYDAYSRKQLLLQFPPAAIRLRYPKCSYVPLLS